MTKKKKIIIGVTVGAAALAAVIVAVFFIMRSMLFRPIDNRHPFQGDGSTHTVAFDSCGGTEVESQTVRDGNPLSTPQSPELDGYVFVGWFTSVDEDAGIWTFTSDRVHSDFTLYARWKPSESITYTESLTYELNGSGYTVTGAGQDAVIVIPPTYNDRPVTEIGERAFAYSNHNADILSVTIPDSVTKIALNAFYNRAETTEVIIGENSSLTTIENNAFSGCGALESIYIPEGVTSIGENAFNNCGALNSITVASDNSVYSDEGNNLIDKSTKTLLRGTNNSVIPVGVTKLNVRAFSKSSLTELVIPVTVTEIGNSVIANSSVAVVRYEGTQEQWDAIQKTRIWNSGTKDLTLIVS